MVSCLYISANGMVASHTSAPTDNFAFETIKACTYIYVILIAFFFVSIQSGKIYGFKENEIVRS